MHNLPVFIVSLTFSVLLLLGGREGGWSKSEFWGFCVFLTAPRGFSSEPTWMISYSSSFSACQSKTPVGTSFFTKCYSLKSDWRILSHLKTRGGQMLSKWLNGARLVVFDEIGHCVVNSVVSMDQKLAWFALVYHKMSTPVPASAMRKHSLLKPLCLAPLMSF